MRSERQRGSARLTLLPGGVGVEESGSAFTTYGCERVDGITSHRIQLHQLSESLSELERQVETLESKYLEVLDTSLIDILRRVGRLLSITREDTTK
jgi:hypothetical protein